MCKKIDLTNRRFGRFLIIKEAGHSNSNKILWKCLCDCGKIKLVTGGDLHSGRTKSCGCLNKELNRRLKTTHGMWGTPEYITWRSMLYRCNNKKSKSFKYYGRRGITICKRWSKFKNFYNDMGAKPKGLTLERIDNNGNYEPNNCKWATQTEQTRNQRLRKDNKTGFAGIFWHKKNLKYQVYIKANYIAHYIGSFANLKQAIIARKKAEQKYWRSIFYVPVEEV